MNVHTELFDVVDENNQVIGQDTRYNVHKNKLLHRAVHIIVRNSVGEVYLQRRSMTKDILPGRWTTSCSGHVDAGETYEIAAVREIKEELGIALDSIDAMEHYFSHAACRETGREFIEVYGLEWNGDIIADPEEISEGRWVAPAALDDWMEKRRSDFAPSFRLVWELGKKHLSK